MKSPSSLYRAALTVCLFFVASLGQVCLAQSVNITSVKVSPDLKRISISCDGPVGKHSAFVIQKPCRLVLDLQSTGLGRTPTRIKVGRGPLDEIRLGYANSRARVVVDFGDHPVPSFKIDKVTNGLLVNLGVKAGAWQPRPKPKPAAQSQSKLVPPKTVASSPASPAVNSSSVSVKTASVKDDQVFVELASKKDPKHTYRVVVDLDVDQLLVRQATVSDNQGHVKRFDFALNKSAGETPTLFQKPSVGPRKAAGPTAAPSEAPAKFKWGVQAGENTQQPAVRLNAGPPIRVERFEPQRIQRRGVAEEG
jgi:AMIN domain